MSDEGLTRALDQWLDSGMPRLVELAQRMVRLDTTSVDLAPGSEHRRNQEGELQRLLASELAAIGGDIDQWEPDAAALANHPMMPAWHHWQDRPITVATFGGAGGGRSLIINGHIDVVDAGYRDRWDSDPFCGEIRDGRLYGRGAVDMKGGIAAALFALAAIGAVGVRLAGDVIFEVVTDEETCAMGTVAAIERGYRADAGLVPEPTGLGVWIATRGLLHGTLTVPGRSAHAEVGQPHWRDGGGVNAIERSIPLLVALQALSEQWQSSSDKRHPLLSAPLVQPTLVNAGSFIASYPESCRISLNATYLPGDADETGYGSVPREEIIRAIAAASRQDDWLQEQPPTWSWATDYPPSEIPADAPIVDVAVRAAATLGVDGSVGGIDTAYDGALLTRLAGVPSPAFGPGSLNRAHAPNEWIGVDELVLGAKAYARAVVEWCGVADGATGA